MQLEIQYALNFLISFLYNKLPRRRVNQFGEELARTLWAKFEGHWYPNMPTKGSAFRCIRCAPPLDPLTFAVAARNSGLNLADIQENLPHELSIWVDPGEVSYRISEKSQVRIIYSQNQNQNRRENNVEPIWRLNPEAQCFKPIEQTTTNVQQPEYSSANNWHNSDSATPKPGGKNLNPMIFTTAAFAATKFGSTKLKSNGKKNQQRTQSAELGNYIKQKQQLQQLKSLHYQATQQGNLSPLLGNEFDLLGLTAVGNEQNLPQQWPLATNDTLTQRECWHSPRNSFISSSSPMMMNDHLMSSQRLTNVMTNPFHDELEATNGNDFFPPNQIQNSSSEPTFESVWATNNSQADMISGHVWEKIFNLNSTEPITDLSNKPLGVNTGLAIPMKDITKASANWSNSPSVSSSESSPIGLIAEFDDLNLCINSNSSSSLGSASSYVN